jgi:uncharacterized membrane protein
MRLIKVIWIQTSVFVRISANILVAHRNYVLYFLSLVFNQSDLIAIFWVDFVGLSECGIFLSVQFPLK